MGLVLSEAWAHGGLEATAMDLPSEALLQPDSWMGLAGALAVAQLGRRYLPLFVLGQLLSPNGALAGLAVMVLARVGLKTGGSAWALALVAGLMIPATSLPLEALALLPLAAVRRPVLWVVGVLGGFALCF